MADYIKLNQTGCVAFTVTAATSVSLSEGDVVEITDDYEVNKPSAAGSVNIIGLIQKATESAGGECVVQSKSHRISKLTSGAAVTVGAVVLNDANKVIDYDDQTHDSAAIIGHALQAAASADLEIDILFKI